MKNRMIISGVIAFLAGVAACKNDSRNVDCDLISGATFTSDSGQMQAILENRCGVSGCHAPGGEGTDEWTYYDEYDSLQVHFEDMYHEAIEEGEMPPDTATQLSGDEKDIFECWQQSGFPE